MEDLNVKMYGEFYIISIAIRGDIDNVMNFNHTFIEYEFYNETVNVTKFDKCMKLKKEGNAISL